MNYINRNHDKVKPFGPSGASSPDIPTTPEDQTSMATTASMKTRGSLRLNPDRRKQKPPPVSLYQMKQKQSPGSSKSHKGAMKALSRAAKAEANRSLSRDSTRQMDDISDDNINNNGDVSPNMSQRSEVSEDLQNTINQTSAMYAQVSPALDQHDGEPTERNISSSNQPEVHIVQIRDIEDVQHGNVEHSQPNWTQNESEI